MRTSTSSRTQSLAALAALVAIALPATAWADADGVLAFGLGVHTTVHRVTAAADRADGALDAGVGAQLRLKLAMAELRVDFDFGHTEEVVAAADAQTLAELVPYPDLRASLGVHPFRNPYFSPFLAVGAGVNTGAVTASPVLIGTVGLETSFLDHWVIGAAAQAVYATPNRYSKFLAARGEVGEQYRIRDFLTPHVFQVLLEVSYYI